MKNSSKTYFELHLYELKCNLFIFLLSFIYLFSILYSYNNQIIYLFIQKLIQTNMLKYFIFTNITEIFLTNITTSFYITLFFSIHILICQLWFFIAVGLYKNENLFLIKIFILYFFFNCIILKIIFFKIIPNIWYFFLNMNFSNKYLFNIYFEPNFSYYFTFITQTFIIIYFSLVYFFFFFLIIYTKIFNINTIINLRKFFYLKFLLITLLISPPDIMNQLLLIFLFFSFFEIFLFFSFFLNQYFFKKS